MRVYLFTDGACSGNPGPGGWACILTDYKKVRELAGHEGLTTNNRMELMGLIAGLKSIRTKDVSVQVYSDSSYVLNGASQWVHSWKKKRWKTSTGSDVVNQDLWEELDRLSVKFEIDWHYIRGHSGNPANERCDEIAVQASQRMDVDLFVGSYEDYSVDLKDLPKDTTIPSYKKSASKQAAFYLSNVNGKVVRHATWGSCEARVKGRSGAKYKKVTNSDDEANLLESWGVTLEQITDE